MTRATLKPDMTILSSIFAVSFFSAALFWILEAYVDTLFIGEISFLTRLFPADSHELWMRGLICALITAFGIYIGYLRWRIRVIKNLNSEVAWLLNRAISKSVRGHFRICAECSKIRDEDGFWLPADRFLATRTDAVTSAGICADCQPQRDQQETAD